MENTGIKDEVIQEIYNYMEPYDNVVLTGLVGLYEICFEQSWKMMKEIKAAVKRLEICQRGNRYVRSETTEIFYSVC